ncbi:MAG: MG2 domain-containing protein [Flavobacteriales bacterium]|nr:MG2 domain-containing protein [Flavobacteriales bacterium]
MKIQKLGKLFLIILSVFMGITMQAQHNKERMKKWQEIEQLIQKQDKPKTALKACKSYYKDIKSDDFAEKARCLIVMRRLESQLTDQTSSFNYKFIELLDKDIVAKKGKVQALISFFAFDLLKKKIRYAPKKHDGKPCEDVEQENWTKDCVEEKMLAYREIYRSHLSSFKKVDLAQVASVFTVQFTNSETPIFTNVYQMMLWKDLNYQLTMLNDDKMLVEKDIVQWIEKGTTKKELFLAIQNDFDALMESISSKKYQTVLKVRKWEKIKSLYISDKTNQVYQNKLLSWLEEEPNNPYYLLSVAFLELQKADRIYAQGTDGLPEVLLKKKSTFYQNALEKAQKALKNTDGKTDFLYKESEKFIKQIELEEYRISLKEQYRSGQGIRVVSDLKNLKKMELHLYQLDRKEVLEVLESKRSYYELRLTDLKKAKKIETFTYNVSGNLPYIFNKKTLILPTMDFGMYAVQVAQSSDIAIFQVSNLSLSEAKDYVSVRDIRQNYYPKNSELILSSDPQKSGQTFDKNRQIKHPDKKSIQAFHIQDGEDILSYFQRYGWRKNYYPEYRENQDIYEDNIFTDRSIYRPGQRVKLKIQRLIREKNTRLFQLLPEEKAIVSLYDPQGELIEEKAVQLGEYASGYLYFDLPKGRMNGNYRFKTNRGGYQYFSVAEYKRPGFLMTHELPNVEQRLGDKIKIEVTGKTYSGVKMANADLSFEVKYKEQPEFYRFWGCGWFWSEPILFEAKDLKLDQEGKAFVEIDTRKIPEKIRNENIISFDVRLKLTDPTGASELETINFVMGQKGLNIDFEIPQTIFEKEALNIQTSVSNFASKNLDKKVKVTVWELEKPKEILMKSSDYKTDNWVLPTEDFSFDKHFIHLTNRQESQPKNWKKLREIKSLEITSNEVSTLLKTLKKGAYEIRLELEDSFGNKIEKQEFLSVLPSKGKLEHWANEIHIKTDKKEYQPGDKINFQLALPFDASYEIQLFNHKGMVWSTCLNGGKTFHEKYEVRKEDYGQLMLITKTKYDGKSYSQEKIISVPWKNKELQAKWITISDKLKPGKKEDWQLQIQDLKGGTPATEVLAFMFDKSLDAIAKHKIKNQLFSYPNRITSFSSNKVKARISNNYLNWRSENPYYPSLENIYQSHFSWNQLIHNSSFYQENRLYPPSRNLNALVSKSSNRLGSIEMDSEAEAYSSDSKLAKVQKKKKPKKQELPRTNFKETVFFFPQLQTDKKGMIRIPFQATDKPGTYKLMVYGYTKELQQFYLEKEIISQKELMIEMHKPKFYYAEDEVEMVAKISNLSKEVQNAEVSLVLKDAETEELLLETALSTVENIGISKSKVHSWKFKIPKNISGALSYELKAENTSFIDIEKGEIPVFTNQKLIKEQIALTIPAGGTQTILLKDWVNQTSFENFRIEGNANTLWQVAQSLPKVKTTNEMIFSGLMDEYFANALGQKLLKENPSLEKRLKKWVESQPKSTLRQNEDLKSIMLEETPWLYDAKNQEEEIKALADYFDDNALSYRNDELETMISKFQKGDGSFVWFKNSRYSSVGMTYYFLENMANLQDLNLENFLWDSEIRSALQYIDKELLEWYQKEKKEPKKFDYRPWRYLQIRNKFENIKPVKNQLSEARDYYLNKAMKKWYQGNLYNRVAVWDIALQYGKMKIAQDIYESVEENSFENTQEQTKYWKKLANGLRYYNQKYVVQAQIGSLYEKMGDAKGRMKIHNWLIQQKRGQHWESNASTIRIVYALLKNNPNEKMFGNQELDLFVNDQKVAWQQNSHLGFKIKEFVNNQGLDLATAKIRFENKSKQPVWVAWHHQYWSKISQVKTQKDPLCSIRKKLYKKEKNGDQINWIPIENTLVKVGDELKVKLDFEFHQALDFVVLEDYLSATQLPWEQLSRWMYNRNGSYYWNIKDQKVQYYFDQVSRGKHSFEYETKVEHTGDFTLGFAEFQSFYAPEFGSRSAGGKLEVQKK